jgi:hypothetical protein
MFEQAFKNIDDTLWKEAGCTTELDYTEQTSWLLFLKYLDGLEQDKAIEALLQGNGTKTRKIWFYQFDPGRNLGKTNPLNDNDLAEFVKLQKSFADSPKSPQEIIDEIAALDAESAMALAAIRRLL